jgi:hypothetical protein
MDAEDAVEKEAFERLNVADIVAIAPVYQHVPQDTPPPVLIIADMDSEPVETKDGGDERVSLILVAVMPGEERVPLRELKALIKRQLDRHQASRGGWRMQFAFEGSDGFLDGDSADYVANFRFSVLALGE